MQGALGRSEASLPSCQEQPCRAMALTALKGCMGLVFQAPRGRVHVGTVASAPSWAHRAKASSCQQLSPKHGAVSGTAAIVLNSRTFPFADG